MKTFAQQLASKQAEVSITATLITINAQNMVATQKAVTAYGLEFQRYALATDGKRRPHYKRDGQWWVGYYTCPRFVQFYPLQKKAKK